MNIRRSAPALVLLSLASAAWMSCGTEDEPSDSTDAGGIGGSLAAGAGGIPSGGSGPGGTGGSAMTTAGAGGSGGGAAMAGAGGSAGMGGAGGTSALPPGCPEITPEPAPGQRLVLRSVNFATGEVVVQNVSSEPITIVSGTTGWQWCQFPSYGFIAQVGIPDQVIAPGEIIGFAVRLFNAQSPTPLNAAGSELAVYNRSTAYTTPTAMELFVSWGTGLPGGGGREPVGVMAGLWTARDRVSVSATSAGFVAVGPSDQASGYRAVAAQCLAFGGRTVPLP